MGEVDAELARLRADVPRRAADAPTVVRTHDKPVVAPAVGMAAAAATIVTPAPGMAAAVSVPKPNPADYVPTGTDLADPKNFGVLPDAADLEMGALSVLEYRQRLIQKIEFATSILHTSGVPAAVWREWRVWEKTAQERLRAAGG